VAKKSQECGGKEGWPSRSSELRGRETGVADRGGGRAVGGDGCTGCDEPAVAADRAKLTLLLQSHFLDSALGTK